MPLATKEVQGTTQLSRCALTASPMMGNFFGLYETNPEDPGKEPLFIRSVPLIQVPLRPQATRHPAMAPVLDWLRKEGDRIHLELRQKLQEVRETVMKDLEPETSTFRVYFSHTYIDASKDGSVYIEDVLTETDAKKEFQSTFEKMYPGHSFQVTRVEKLGPYPMSVPLDQKT